VILWRISDHATLDGGGGVSLSGRWHTAGRRIVYCAPNPATALLEVLVHTEISFDDVTGGCKRAARLCSACPP
jgi:RES domain-containing protein